MKKQYTLKFVITLAFIASALSCAVILLTIGRQFGMFSGRFRSVRDYAQLLKSIDELYIGDYSESEIHDASMNAAVDTLGDRWSYYMTPEEYGEYLDYSNNSYIGIGIGVETNEEHGGLSVLYVYKGSAAETAGVLVGDVITAIDDEDITGIGLEDATQMLSREIGDAVSLTVMREGDSVHTLEAVYGIVFTAPVNFEIISDDIGYVELYNFVGGSADSFVEAVDTLIEQGAQSFIFDVRCNGGGRVSELTRILDYLLPEGEIFISVTKDGAEEITESDPSAIDLPAVVLVNEYSYSAAEYFAAILREYDYADIVGERTTGKNRSQVTIEMPGGGALHISSGEYLTKNRVSLYDTEGLKPDVSVELTEEELMMLISGALPHESDPQILAAVSMLSDMPVS